MTNEEVVTELPICWAELSSLSDDEKAVVGVLSYATTESNALRRMFIFASHEMVGEDAIDTAISIQRFVLLRTASSRLFEVKEFLEFGGKRKTLKDEKILAFAAEALDAFEKLKGKNGYEIARNMRHEATHHYSLSAARKNLRHVPSNANCSLYLHQMTGNSYYPMGEEVMFVGGMNRVGAKFSSKEEKQELINEWYEWNLAASQWLENTFTSCLKLFLLPKFPQKKALRKSFRLGPELVSSPDEHKVPIFLGDVSNVTN
ncbi:hypothetical protein [Leisingera caerulea]|uniref:Uncharacterized protein n=1 Tax=Leisingera caerulea TaxID=506591 RepID=A0A9Q9HL55_LEICA|nr:hypothetical protein [Leisingera caerulea]UWQ54265.1 hypothetical protein K3721_01635 [Leisingera caerulea]